MTAGVSLSLGTLPREVLPPHASALQHDSSLTEVIYVKPLQGVVQALLSQSTLHPTYHTGVPKINLTANQMRSFL